MNYCKSGILSMILLLVFCNISYPQYSPGKVLAFPLKYNRPYERMVLSPSQERLPSVRWQVYSDRVANVTYTTPGGDKRKATLSFMEKFYVADEEEEFIRLVKDPKIDVLTLSANTRFYGWIHKSKMLLWSRCLMSEKSRINRKSIILNTVRHLRKLDGREPDIVKFRSAPGGQSHVTYKSHFFEIYFVYKTTKDFILLGKNHRIEQQAAANTYVLGWVPRARLTFWDHRVAIEPNWEKAAAKERKYGRKARIFLDIQYAAEYRDGGNIASTAVIWENDPFDKRHIGEWMRFPILKNEEETGEKDIVIAGVVGEIQASEHEKYHLNLSAATPMRVKGQKHDLFKRVLFLSSDELGKLTDNMDKLADVVREYELRESLIQNWTQLVQSYEGGLSDEDIEGMTNEQLTEIVFGLPAKSEFLKNLTIRDIRNPRRISSAALGRYWKDIVDKAKKLRKIYNSNLEQYPYSFRSNGIHYYWISEDDLP